MKKKYIVTGVISASTILGEYEAESKDQAEEMAKQDENANWNPSLCNHCSNGVDLSDVYEVIVEENE